MAAMADADADELAWRLFIALNWPVDTEASAADPRAALGADRAAVWERWENSADVYRDDGGDPGPWGAVRESAVAGEHRFESLSLKDFPDARHIVAGRMVRLADRLASAKRLIEIRMNRTAFDYIRAAGLYNLDGQIRTVTSGRPVEFPRGAIEVKASWVPIDEAAQSRYHIVRVRLADGSIRLYGLNALNIAAKSQPQWFWASFEHIDNATRDGAKGWSLPSRDTFACRGMAPDCNRSPKGVGLRQSLWGNYRLRGTLTRYVDSAGNPQRLGNSELEAGFEDTASCMTCHSRSAMSVVNGVPLRLSIFDERAGGDGVLRRGYVGLPDSNWYHPTAADSRRSPTYQSLDFVWSLAQAKPRRDIGNIAEGGS